MGPSVRLMRDRLDRLGNVRVLCSTLIAWRIVVRLRGSVVFTILLCLVLATGCRKRSPNAQPPVTSAPATAQESAEERLQTLYKLRQDGLITQQEYETRRKAILQGI